MRCCAECGSWHCLGCLDWEARAGAAVCTGCRARGLKPRPCAAAGCHWGSYCSCAHCGRRFCAAHLPSDHCAQCEAFLGDPRTSDGDSSYSPSSPEVPSAQEVPF